MIAAAPRSSRAQARDKTVGTVGRPYVVSVPKVPRPSTSLGMNGVLLTALVLSTTAAAAPPDRLAAVFAGGVLDLMTEPNRDVTASFAALVSAPIGYPREHRAQEFSFLSMGIPGGARALDAKVAEDRPVLVGICGDTSGGSWKGEAILQGTRRAWKMHLVAATRSQFLFISVQPLPERAGTAKQYLVSTPRSCNEVRRDAAGEVFFANETKPVLFEATPRTPWASGSDHLLDLPVDPDLAIAGLMPAEIFAAQHRELPRPRAVGVLSLIAASDALSFLRSSLTVVAWPPTPSDEAVFIAGGSEQVLVAGFRNGYFTTPRMLAPSAAITGPWSKWSWSMVEQRMPAEILLDMTRAAAACLDALQKNPGLNLGTQVQKCFDLSLADAGASFRVRRERWLGPVRNVETAATAAVESFCADQGVLCALPFFQPRPGSRNAGPLMTATLGWEPRIGDPRRYPGSLQLPRELEKRFSVSGFMELSDKELSDTAAADTSFLTKLADFDRWELVGGNGPLTAEAPHNAPFAALPAFSQLTLAARLHLRRAVKNGKLVQAASEVRHAARLAFTTETLVGQSTGASLLTIEWRAFDWARRHKLPTTGWTPLDEATLERVNRVVIAAPAFFSPMATDATSARAKACDQVTQCAALTEVVAVNAGMESIFREPWGARYRSVVETIAAPNARCSFGTARYWSSRPMIEVAAAKLSRNQEVIAGAMMSAAATRFYLPCLERAYKIALPTPDEL